MKRFLDLLSSLKLAIALMAILTLGSILATLIPQGMDPASYRELYSAPLAKLLVWSGFDHFFGSLGFLIVAMVFVANLSTCAIRRFLKELRKPGVRRFGPDILHLGLVLLAIGAIWSNVGRIEGSAFLAPGEGISLPGGSTLLLEEFRFERYEDGRPKDWISMLRLGRDGAAPGTQIELRVNHPLRLSGLTLYQASYGNAWILALKDATGQALVLKQGEERRFGGKAYTFLSPEFANPDSPGQALVRVIDAMGVGGTFKAGLGEKVGDLESTDLRYVMTTGIQAVVDPGYPLVFFALLLVALGAVWTFAQKLKEGI